MCSYCQELLIFLLLAPGPMLLLNLKRLDLCSLKLITLDIKYIVIYETCCRGNTQYQQTNADEQLIEIPGVSSCWRVNTLGPRQDGRLFPDDTFKRIFLNVNIIISNKISLKFVPKGPINNIPTLVQIMAWRRPGDKPLSEPMMVSLMTHICVTRPQWVNAANMHSSVNSF